MGILGGTLNQLGGGFSSLGNVISGFAGAGVAGAAIAAVGEVTKGLEWSIKEAAASEQAFTNLAAAVDRSGTSWTTVEGKTRDYLSQLQKTTVYSDEALAGMVERLLTFGMTYDQAMGAAGAALDLAAAKHMDLQEAANLVGKAVDGNTAILKRYGVDVEVAKDATDKFTPVIAALNEQFGGAAQAQAQTYAGIQERLKNATSELGEKIGGILLPALSTMTEAMIPVVDSLGKGVEGIQAWLTEVGKMPEVQGVMAVVNEAFQGFWSYLNDLWKFIQDTFSPVLEELWQAFKDLWDALSPIGEAFSEILGIFGEGTEGIDLLKLAVQAIAFEIRGFAEIIKAVAPYIKMFAQGFKDAADFIAPILRQMIDAITGFLDALKNAFQGFYNWLVGGSLWMEMWNALLSIASIMIGTLLGDLGTKLFEPMKSAFTGALQWVEDSWSKGWQAVHTAFTTISTEIGTDLNAKLQLMKDAISTSTSEYAPIATQALDGMQSAVNAGMDLIKGDWQGALDHIRDALAQFGAAAQATTSALMGQLESAVKGGLNAIKGAWDGFVSAIQSGVTTVQNAFSSVSGYIQQGLETVQSVTAPATSAITNAFTGAFNAITGAAQSFWNWLVGGSLWPEMLTEMVKQTKAGLGKTVSLTKDQLQALGDLFAETGVPALGITPEDVQAIIAFLSWAADIFTDATKTLTTLWQTCWMQMSYATTYACEGIKTALTNAFTGILQSTMMGLQMMIQAWTMAWQTIQMNLANSFTMIMTSFTNFWAQLQALTLYNLQVMSQTWLTAFTTMLTNLAAWFETTLAGFTAFFEALAALWTEGWTNIFTILTNTLAAMQAALVAGATLMLETMQTFLNTLVSAVESAEQRIIASFNRIAAAAVACAAQACAAAAQAAGCAASAAASAASAAASAASSMASLASSAQATSNQLVGHSIWPDMLERMQDLTHAALAGIVGDFQGAFGGIAVAAPVAAAPPYTAPAERVVSAPSMPQTITIPITVKLDGETIARITERRLVTAVDARGRKVA